VDLSSSEAQGWSRLSGYAPPNQLTRWSAQSLPPVVPGGSGERMTRKTCVAWVASRNPGNNERG